MRWVAMLVLALAACGDNEKRCAIACGEGRACPNGMTCSAGACGPTPESCIPAFSTVRAGGGFACALDQHRRLWCWGDNANRAILGSPASREPLAVVAGERRWDAIAVGGGHVCALDGAALWCWGDNFVGQVHGDAPPVVVEPFEIGRGVAWSSVSAGEDSTCAIGDGALYCWGSGRGGKLGTGRVDSEPFPARVATEFLDWTTVAVGARHACAASRSRGLHCWGDGSQGQLGNGLAVVRPTPERVLIDDEVSSIAAGLESTCATTSAGELWCWGRAADGALGDPRLVDPDAGDRTTPVRASDLAGWSEVASAERYACARRGGEVWCWGSASSGGIGDGRWRSARGFARVLDGAEALAIGWNGTSATLLTDEGDLDLTCAAGGGVVRCWGDNRSGQLAQGGASQSAVPVAIAGGNAWDTIVAGDAHACGIAGGAVWCWGSAERGQVTGAAAGAATPCTPDACGATSPVAVATGATAIAAGAAHTCKLDGAALACWGANDDGQCSATPSISATTTVVAGEFAVLLGAGARATCAATATETQCWGAALASGALPRHEVALDGSRVFAGGLDFGCALGASGALACFGDAARFGNGGAGTCGDGACNNGETAGTCAADCGPPPLTHLDRTYQELAIGREAYACGLRTDGVVECWGDNFYGQTGEPVNLASPVPFALPLVGCTRVSTGNRHACAVCAGALSCWGDASHGELGDPITLESVTTPRIIAPPIAGDEWLEVAAGGGFTCARTRSGAGYCWGRSLHGALGGGPGSAGSNLPLPVRY